MRRVLVLIALLTAALLTSTAHAQPNVVPAGVTGLFIDTEQHRYINESSAAVLWAEFVNYLGAPVTPAKACVRLEDEKSKRVLLAWQCEEPLTTLACKWNATRTCWFYVLPSESMKFVNAQAQGYELELHTATIAYEFAGPCSGGTCVMQDKVTFPVRRIRFDNVPLPD